MAVGLVGKKCGMTRVFTELGESIPVTVIEVAPNAITQIKTVENDGYRAIQIATCAKKATALNKAIAGHLAKAGVEPSEIIQEFYLEGQEFPEAKLGDQLTVEIFKEGQSIDVRGLSRGKGFAGVIKRHNFRSQDVSHGNSLTTRAPGSVGQCQTPGRVFKGKKLPGHLGNVNCTVQNQVVIKVDPSRNLLLVKGAVPGAPGGKVVIMPAVKKPNKGGE